VKKTLVLVVDRDDDFGVKAGVESPAIGVEACSVAASALGIADPEDSDINAVFAAISIYKDIIGEGKDAEIALICGNPKIGHRSDSAIIDELNQVLEEVSPDRVILVGDGAEDEYVYPIISSRVPIDSVKKVFVKQAPGLEGTVYVISKLMSDPAKKKRFFTPIGWMLALIALAYIIPMLYLYGFAPSNFQRVSGATIALIIGIMILVSGYSLIDRISDAMSKMYQRIKSGSLITTFVLMALALIVSGLVLGVLTIRDYYSPSLYLMVLRFGTVTVWPFIFGYLVYALGGAIEEYLSSGCIKLSFITGTINMLGVGMVLIGAMDLFMSYISTGLNITGIIAAEIAVGVSLTIISSILRRHLKRYVITSVPPAEA
jgi:putative membrane protein